jgi:mannose-6-phosphate isomerase-like protein (cupin superfamily)
MSFTLKEIDRMQALHHGVVKLAGAELGVESFGMQLLDVPAGFADYPEHDHAADGMEEVYVVLHGSGVFHIDGERVPLDPTSMLRVAASATRRLEPGPEGVRLLAIGCTQDRPYERPESFRLAAQS